MSLWTVQYRPVEHGDVRGLGVFITDGGANEREVGRVAFVRDNAKKDQRKTEFSAALDEITKRADKAADLINETLEEVERLNEIAEQERQDREYDAVARLEKQIQEAVGSTPRPSSFA